MVTTVMVTTAELSWRRRPGRGHSRTGRPSFSAIVAAGQTYAYPQNLSLEDDTILGSAKMSPDRPGRGSHVATASFMVESDCHGRGGRALGDQHGHCALVAGAGLSDIRYGPGAFDHPEHGLVGLHVMFQLLPGGEARDRTSMRPRSR